MSSKKYLALGLAIFLVASFFVLCQEEGSLYRPEFTGIAGEAVPTEHGYVFYLEAADGKIKCYSDSEPEYLGYYGIRGEYSADGNIYFVKHMVLLERRADIQIRVIGISPAVFSCTLPSTIRIP